MHHTRAVELRRATTVLLGCVFPWFSSVGALSTELHQGNRVRGTNVDRWGRDEAAGALYREWVRAVQEADALAETAARLERDGAEVDAVERAWGRSEHADRTCDQATRRLLEAKPDTLGGLLDKAHCVRWRMEDRVDQELVGGLIGDIRRMAGA